MVERVNGIILKETYGSKEEMELGLTVFLLHYML